MYAEEMDWCKRVKNAGWEIIYVGDAKIIHHSGQSASQVKARSHIHFQHSKLRYFRKFHGWHAATLIWLVLIVNYGLQLGIEGTKWLVGHKRTMRAERITVYWKVMRSLLWSGEKIALKET